MARNIGTPALIAVIIFTQACADSTNEGGRLTLTPLTPDVVVGQDTTTVRAYARVTRGTDPAAATVFFCDDSPASAWSPSSVAGTDDQGLAFADLAIPQSETDTVTIRVGLRFDQCTTLLARIPPP